MRVKLTTMNLEQGGKHYGPGDVVEVSDELAHDWITKGSAVAVEEPTKPARSRKED